MRARSRCSRSRRIDVHAVRDRVEERAEPGRLVDERQMR